jgi:hypothetical protein
LRATDIETDVHLSCHVMTKAALYNITCQRYTLFQET